MRMTEDRTKNVSRNILFGSINKITSLLLPFITRTMLLYLLGKSSLGVSTLFSSILSFLSLAELGIGSAVVYKMYKPVAENDIETIDSLLLYYKKIYIVIGCIMLGIGICLAPFLPYLIKGTVPEGLNLYVLFFMFLFNAVISYFFAGYRQSLLIAYQRIDIRDKIAMVVTLFVRISEILVIYFSRNLYAYVGVTIIGTVTTNILTAWVTKKMFPEIRCHGLVPDSTRKEIRKRLGGLFGTKLNSIVVNQADTIVISAFLGLSFVTLYGNYYYILNTISGFVMMIFSSMTASIGNKIASGSNEDIYALFKRINFANNWLVGWSSICMVCLYQPFMLIWVKEDLTLPVWMSLLMSVYFYMYQIQRTILTFKDASGLWYEDRMRPYVSMILNVLSNIILVQIIGIYGIVLSTILSFAISIPWCNHVLFSKLFNVSPWINMKLMAKNLLITTIVGIVTYSICMPCQASIPGLIIRMIICIVIPNVLFYFVFHKTDEYDYIQAITQNIIRRRTRA